MKKYRKRAHLTEAEKAVMWDRWQQRQAKVKDLARRRNKLDERVYRYVSQLFD